MLLAQQVKIDTDLRNHPEILWYPPFDNLEAARADWWMSTSYRTPYGVDVSVVDAPEFGMKAFRYGSQYTGWTWNGEGSSIINWRKWLNYNTKGVSGTQTVGNVPLNGLYMRFLFMMEPDVLVGMTEEMVKLSGFVTDLGVSTTFVQMKPDSQGRVRLTTYLRGEGLWQNYDGTPNTYGGDWVPDYYIQPGRWYSLETYLKLNSMNPDGTPNADGALILWIGDPVAGVEREVFRRENTILHRSTKQPLEINHIHGQLYHGGNQTPKAQIHYRMTGFALAKRRIGMPQLVY